MACLAEILVVYEVILHLKPLFNNCYLRSERPVGLHIYFCKSLWDDSRCFHVSLNPKHLPNIRWRLPGWGEGYFDGDVLILHAQLLEAAL